MRHLVLGICILLLIGAGIMFSMAGIAPLLNEPPGAPSVVLAAMGLGCLLISVGLAIPMRLGEAVQQLKGVGAVVRSIVPGRRGDAGSSDGEPS